MIHVVSAIITGSVTQFSRKQFLYGSAAPSNKEDR